MTTWLFQGNPDTFDIDGYLAVSSGIITWLGGDSQKTTLRIPVRSRGLQQREVHDGDG
jgi:hypothetical protein